MFAVDVLSLDAQRYRVADLNVDGNPDLGSLCQVLNRRTTREPTLSPTATPAPTAAPAVAWWVWSGGLMLGLAAMAAFLLYTRRKFGAGHALYLALGIDEVPLLRLVVGEYSATTSY